MSIIPNHSSATKPSLLLDSLPHDILLIIFSFLNLRSIANLAATSHSLAALARSDLLWRPIVSRLVGPWIHHPRLPSPHHHPPLPLPTSDWTLSASFLPLKQPLQSPHQASFNPIASVEPITSWYGFATRFLIPNFNYLGWHMSDQQPEGRLVLVTLDTFSGRLMAEEIVCLNIYNRKLYRTTPLSPVPTAFAALSRAFLPPSCPDPPSWLPLEHVQMLSSRDGYQMAQGSAHAGFQIDIFAPAHVSVPWFTLSAFEPHCVLAGEPASCGRLAIEPVLSTSSWETGTSSHGSPLPNATRLFPHRTDVRDLVVLAARPLDLVTETGLGREEHHCFAVSSVGAAAPPPPPGWSSRDQGRIHYQDPPVRRNPVPVCALWAGGRAYVVGERGQLVEYIGAEERRVRFHALDGPAPAGLQRSQGLEGLWVGCYGTHGCEYGRIVVETDDQGKQLMMFIKVTGDANVPAGEVSWMVESRSLRAISREEAVESDITDNDSDGRWLKGTARVANQMFREPQWIEAEVQLIKHDDPKEDRIECALIEEIRVKWIALNHIASFSRVKFV